MHLLVIAGFADRATRRAGGKPAFAAVCAAYREALATGDTLGHHGRPCIHWLDTGKERWLRRQRAAGWRIVAVELAEGALPLTLLEPADHRTIVLLGHERRGLPDDLVESADARVEIPMVGPGASLNVAVAGRLVIYRLAGLV